MGYLSVGGRGLRRTSEPANPAVTVADVQTYGNISGDDARLTQLISMATDLAEKYMGRALITQTWKMSLDRWPNSGRDWWDTWHAIRTDVNPPTLILPYAPLQSITSITTYDDDDTSTAITVNDYFITDTNSEPGRLVLRSGESWPTDTRIGVRIEVVYVSGYGNDESYVPEGIQMGLCQLVLWMYEHLGDCDSGSPLKKSGAIDAFRTYKIIRVN